MSQLVGRVYFALAHELLLVHRNERGAFIYFAKASRYGYAQATAVLGFLFEFGISLKGANFPVAERYAIRGNSFCCCRDLFFLSN